MRSLISLLLLLLSNIGLSWTPVQLDKFDLRIMKFTGNQDPMTPEIDPERYKYRAAADFDISLLGIGFWENQIHTEAVEHAVKSVGWHWNLGVRITSWLDAMYEHHSRHVLDQEQYLRKEWEESPKFPVEDSYGLRIHVYIGTGKKRSLFE